VCDWVPSPSLSDIVWEFAVAIARNSPSQLLKMEFNMVIEFSCAKATVSAPVVFDNQAVDLL
jgi:hypothetical protein